MQIQRKLLGWWRCTPCQQVRRDKRKLLDARFGLPLLHNFFFKKEKESAGSGDGDILALRTTTCPHFLTTIVGGAFVPFYRHIQNEGANIHGERGGKLPSYFQRHDLPPFFFHFCCLSLSCIQEMFFHRSCQQVKCASCCKRTASRYPQHIHTYHAGMRPWRRSSQ